MKSEYCEDVEWRWGYEDMELDSCENFVGKWEELVFDAFGDSEPVERAYDGSLADHNTSQHDVQLEEMLAAVLGENARNIAWKCS